MNANELADALDWVCENHLIGIGNADFKATATMLRQQQAEINTLRNHGYKTQYELLRIEFLQQQSEIEALKELNTMLKDAIEKRIGMDAERYKWLRAEFAAGRETYLAEGMPSGESLDKYIDGKLK